MKGTLLCLSMLNRPLLFMLVMGFLMVGSAKAGCSDVRDARAKVTCNSQSQAFDCVVYISLFVIPLNLAST